MSCAGQKEILKAQKTFEIRESATRVKMWFRSVGVELNESALVSARVTDDNEMTRLLER